MEEVNHDMLVRSVESDNEYQVNSKMIYQNVHVQIGGNITGHSTRKKPVDEARDLFRDAYLGYTSRETIETCGSQKKKLNRAEEEYVPGPSSPEVPEVQESVDEEHGLKGGIFQHTKMQRQTQSNPAILEEVRILSTIEKDATDNVRTNIKQEQEVIYTAEPVNVTIQTQDKSYEVPTENSLLELLNRKIRDYLEASEELCKRTRSTQSIC
ncbi:unnamed protein product [Mytilus edulis]|uniref:Uncharacterized protein n=1 Tax=Mytilus edulis TaxID=6550 RepID=A0A8S3V835_MYTED|nr:unnamed protein product [Mytilus edulis]